MAQEAAAAFVKRYGRDEAFRTKVTGLDGPQAIRNHLDQEGFGQFTRQELEEARKAASASGELSDTELDAVAGGAWGVPLQVDCNKLSPIGGQVECTSVW